MKIFLPNIRKKILNLRNKPHKNNEHTTSVLQDLGDSLQSKTPLCTCITN